MRRSFLVPLVVPVFVGLLSLAADVAAAGTILATGQYATKPQGGFPYPALFAIDARTGARTILSDFGDPRQGPVGVEPSDVAVTRRGRIVVLDRNAGAYASFGSVFYVDPRGRRTLLSDLSDPAQGPTGVTPEALAVAPSGTIYVVDSDADLQHPNGNLVFAIDPRSGARSIVSRFGDPAQGPTLDSDLTSIAVQSDGTLLVLATIALYAVDPTNGQRTIVSDFLDQAQGSPTASPSDVAVGKGGEILIADPDLFAQDEGAGGRRAGGVLRIDPATGFRSVVSDASDPAQGVELDGTWSLAVGSARTLYTAAGLLVSGTGMVAIDLVDGSRSLVAELSSLRPQWHAYALGIAYHPAQLVRCARTRSCATPLPMPR